jgi:hypothetical protein
MSLYTCFDWFKKLTLFSYVLNLKIDVFLKVSRAVVIRRFSLNEAPLRLFKFISVYLPYFEKKYILQYHSKKSLNLFIRIDRNYLFGSFEITSIRLYTPLRNPLFLYEPNTNCDQSLKYSRYFFLFMSIKFDVNFFLFDLYLFLIS